MAIKRYHLAIPEELFEKVQTVADAKGITVVELLRKFIQLGLIVAKLNPEEGETLLIQEGEKVREITFL